MQAFARILVKYDYNVKAYTEVQRQKLGKYLQVGRTSYFRALRSFQLLTGPLFQIKLHVLSILTQGFQSSRDLWNPLSKAVPGKFHGFGRLSKYNCLQQDRANFHRSLAWQIVLVFNTCNLVTVDFLQITYIMTQLTRHSLPTRWAIAGALLSSNNINSSRPSDAIDLGQYWLR